MIGLDRPPGATIRQYEWREAPSRRPAIYADAEGCRVFVEQTVRSHCAHPMIGTEFQVSVAGVRLGEYPSAETAALAGVCAARNKKGPAVARGASDDGLVFDY